MTCEVGVQWKILILASKQAKEDDVRNKDYCALLMDEMIITNGIMYSVSQQKVYGLAEMPSHGINNEIYHDFYRMNCNETVVEDMSRMTYFDETSNKLSGHTATGLTQVFILRSYNYCCCTII